MPGNGQIGGGSVYLNFQVKYKGPKRTTSWRANDGDAVGHVEIKFPRLANRRRIVRVRLQRNQKILIKWS